MTIDRPNVSLHAWIRRAASKVTVSFDAKNLNENIFIYLKSAQIRDIPSHCSLVDDNTPTSTDELIAEGDTILYGKGDDYTNWPKLSCGRGANTFGNHAEYAPSLFFYENMQGQHPDKHLYQGPDKDNVLNGTFLEVKGYYINRSVDNPSYGNITYRCMLGRNMEDDFDAERNAHYKLTLVFNKDANNPDWHIDYEYVPQPPEIVVASPMYISYLSNQQLTIPLTVYYDKNITEVTKVTAEIIGNDWGYYDHPYIDKAANALTDGFLSLGFIDKTSVGDRTKEYVGEQTYNNPVSVDDERYRFDIPVYTRPMTLGKGFSGNNYSVGRRRYAKVRFTAWNGERKLTEKVVEVIQSRRLVNPKGIWRAGTSTKAFRITLKNSDSSPNVAHEFEALPSDGPWTAKILDGSEWVRIKDAESDEWGTEPIIGGTGSNIEFDYKPATEYRDGSRFGRIEITFHNNTCTHVVLVSQGLGPVEIEGRKWHMTNVEYCGTDTANPLLEGAMFKFGNSTDAIASSNNLKDGYGFDIPCYDKTFDVYNASGGKSSKTFKAISAYRNGFSDAGMKKDGDKACHVATAEDWKSLLNPTQFIRYYGILYGDECDHTLDANTVTNTYTSVGQERGMRGCFVYDTKTQRHLFFPIGNTGYGRRKHKDQTATNTPLRGNGVLKYANRAEEMDEATAIGMPCFYDLYTSTGALYYYGLRSLKAGKSPTSTNDNDFDYGFDINYFTFGFESYQTNVMFLDRNTSSNLSSDAAFLRRVDD